MRRAGRIGLWVLGIVMVLPVVLVLAVVLAANTGAGQLLLASQVGRFSGGMVTLTGLSGRFPDALRLQRLEVRDARGVWLEAEGVRLDWSPLALLRRSARVDELAAARIGVARLPVAAPAATPASGGGFSLPVQVDVRSLEVGALALGPGVAGTAAVLQVTGHALVAPFSAGNAGQAGDAVLQVTRRDAPGAYRVEADVSAGSITAHARLREPAGGLLARLGGLPALGALDVALSVDGPRQAEQAHLVATAGPLSVTGGGSVDLPGQTEAMTLTVTAPAMRPRADLGWQGVDLHGQVTGSFTRPDASVHLAVTGLFAGGATLPSLVADITGNQGQVGLKAELTGLQLPGPAGDLFAREPIELTGDARLDAASRPVRFTLSHKLLAVEGTASTAGEIAARIHTIVPEIAPFAAMGHVDLRGRTDATATLAEHHGDTDVSINGSALFNAGVAPVPALLGRTDFSAAATLAGQDITLRDARVDGRALHADVHGTDKADGLALAWSLGLPDLAAVSPSLLGALKAVGQITGKPGGLAVTASVTGQAGASKFPAAPVQLTLEAQNLPSAPHGSVTASFRVAGAPAAVLADASTDPDGALHVRLQRATWKSLTARADLALPKGESVPVGSARLAMPRLADLSALAGQPIAGGLTAELTSNDRMARIVVRGTGLAAGANRVADLSLTGSAAGLQANPDIDATLQLNGLEASGLSGSARLTALGRPAALRLRLQTALQDLAGAPARLDTEAVLDAPHRHVTVQRLAGDWKTLALRLQAPAAVDFGTQTAVDHLRLAVNQAQISLAGRVSPTMDLTASLRNVTPDLAQVFLPDLRATGVLAADAHVTGTTTAPGGVVHLAATGLQLRSGAAAAVPAASVTATIDLAGTSAAVEARIDAGPRLHLTAAGRVPLAVNGAFTLRTQGALDLALANPILEADGRAVKGHAALDLTVSGAARAPQLNGAMTLTGGSVQDYVQGVHLTGVTARLEAQGDTLRIAQFQANAAPGTMTASGSVGVLAPGLPVDLHLVARNARPLAGDLVSALFDADLAVHGQARETLRADGTVRLRRVDINVPDSLPAGVTVLRVRRPGDQPEKMAPRAAPATNIMLQIAIDAPGNIFVRGHGLDAELGGKLDVAGNASAPVVSGAFDMRRGDFSLAGTTLTFSKGNVSFNGTGISGRIDPTLYFEADSYQGGITATLKVTGFADAPKIGLSSVPDLPQDEVLAHLLFGQSVKQLSAIQIAEIGAALAELSGVTGGANPLNGIRKGLGLDRLNVGAGTNGAGAAVEAGRYVAKGVYVGAKQATGGAGGTQAQVQVDLTRHLKVQTTLSSGGGSAQGATPENDPGSSIGLSYQFEY
jgi:translocation and assembly module TamB